MCAARAEYTRLDATGSARHRWGKIRDGFLEGCRLLANAEYLSSPLSRRDVRVVIWPAMLLVNLFIDLVDENDYKGRHTLVVCLDALLLLCGCVATFCVPSHSLWSDFLCALSAFVIFAVQHAWFPQLTVFSPAVLTSMCASGMHIACVLAFGIGMCVFDIFLTAYGWLTLLLSGLTASTCCFFDLRCARNCLELKREKNAVRYLLQNAGHGSCNVCIDDRKIVSFNAKLAETLGTEDLFGVELNRFVNSADIDRMAELFKSVATQEDFVPILVTCRTRLCEFDVKLIPFAVEAGNVRLFVQIQGERRLHSGVGPPRSLAGAGGSAMAGDSAGRRPISNPSCFDGEEGLPAKAPSVTSLAYSRSTRPVTTTEVAVQTDNTQSHGRPPLLVDATSSISQQPTSTRPKSERSRRSHSKSIGVSSEQLMELTRHQGFRKAAFDWSSSASSEQHSTDRHQGPPLVPGIIEGSGVESTSLVLCACSNQILGCTPGFTALTGPLFFKASARDLIANYADFLAWIQSEGSWIMNDDDYERRPFGVKLARKSLRHHANFEFHATAIVAEFEEFATPEDMGVEPVEDDQEEEYPMVFIVTLADIQVKWLGGGTLLGPRTHPAADNEGARATASASHVEHWRDDAEMFRLVPHMPWGTTLDAICVLVNTGKAHIVACTCEFSSLTGPLPFGTNLRDLAINYRELMKWMHLHVGELPVKGIEEIPPFDIKIAPPFLKRRRKFEFHAAVHLVRIEDLPDVEMGSEQATCDGQGAHGLLALRDVKVNWHPRSGS